MVMPQFGGIPGLPTGPQSFAPSFTQEQIDQLSPEDLRRLEQQLSRGPQAPGTTLGQRTREAGREVLGKSKAFLDTFVQGIGAMPAGRLSVLGGMVAPAMTAIEEAQAGRPTGALGALGGGAAGALGGMALGRVALGGIAAMPGAAGLIGKVGQAALPVIGGMLGAPAGAQALESARQKATGEPTKGKEQDFSTQMAMRGQILNQNLDALNRSAAVELQATKDLTTFHNQAAVQQYKAMAPELEKTKMNDFARYQTAMALQGQIQGQLGTLATAGALAQGAQAGNYALTQTALTNNPYTQAIMPAPQIRFG